VADRKTKTKREAGEEKRHAGRVDPALILEDLVRVLARSAACEAHEASQTKKDDAAHGP